MQQKVKVLQKLYDSGCKTEKDLKALSLQSILKIPDISVSDMTVITELQEQISKTGCFPIWEVRMMSSSQSKTKDRHIIWSDINLDLDDWREDLQAEYPDLSEDELYQTMYEINGDYLDNERENLDIQLSQPIIIIGDLGRWDGRVTGYKMIDSGNIKDCLYSDTDMTEWYVDKYGDFRADAIHHDGTNHYLYRVFKNNASPEQIERLQEKIYFGRATRADITRVTRRLGDDIAAVYGFHIPKQRAAMEQVR